MIQPEYLRILFAVGGLLLPSCFSQSGPLSPGQGGPKWTRVDSANFRVFTDLDAKNATRIALQLEQDLDALGQAAFKSVRPAVNGTDVIVFANRDDYQHFAHDATEGVFYSRLPLDPESTSTVITFGGVNRQTRTRLLHELTHDLFDRNFGAAPTWLHEGWAEYYSTVRVVDGMVQIGAALPDKTLTTDSSPFVAELEGREVVAIPIANLASPSQLMTMSGEDFYELSTDETPDFETTLRRTSRYLGAWAFVHMLLDGKNPYAERFKVFQSEVLDSAVQDAWVRAFAGVSSQQLDQYFRTYLATSKLRVFGVPYKNNVGNQISLRSLSDGEVHLLWGRLHSVSWRALDADRSVAARKELSIAVTVAPDLAEAHHWQGCFCWPSNAGTRRTWRLHTQLRLDPNEPRFLVYTAAFGTPTARRQVANRTSLRPWSPKLDRLIALAKSAQQLLIVAHYQQARGNAEQALILALERWL